MYKLLSFIAALLMAVSTDAQNAKFGKPTQEEWDLNSVSFAPDAEAVVLYKSVDVTYKLSGGFGAYGSNGDGSLDDSGSASTGVNKQIDPETTSMLYNVKVRTKILKDSGLGYASMDIIIFDDQDDQNVCEEFYEMNVVVYSQVNGKVKKKRLAATNIKNERVDKFYSIRHVRVPEAKAGDIIEYQYQLFSNRITFIYDTQLQESIPMLYAECKMNIPYFLQFNVNKPEIKNVGGTVALGNLQIGELQNGFELPKQCQTNVYTIVARDMPAYDGVIDLENLTSGKVYCVRTELKEKRFDVKPDASGPVRHLIIGK